MSEDQVIRTRTNYQGNWRLPVSDWVQTTEDTFLSAWQETANQDSIKRNLGSAKIPIPPGEAGFSKRRFHNLLATVSSKIGGDGAISYETWKKISRDGKNTRHSEQVANTLGVIHGVLGFPKIESPWSLEVLPEFLRPSDPWPSRFNNRKLFHPFSKTDYADTADLITSIRRPCRYYAGLHTAEHLRDMIEVILANRHIESLVLRAMGTEVLEMSENVDWLLPDWFVGGLCMNLMIVEKKVRMARSEGGRNLEIFVVPYTGLSASMGALIATPKDDFSEVRGIYYSGSWSICSPVATSPDVHRFETFLGPDRETPIQRVSLMGAMPYHRDGLTTENGWHCERPSLNKEASINSLNELPLATDGFDEAAADAIMETEGQFARRKSKLLWLPRDAFEKHGMSVDEYIDSIVPFEKLLTKRKVRPIRQRKTRAATKRRDR